MARGFTTASSQKVEVASASLPTALPVTIAMWVYLPATPAATEAMFQFGLDTDNFCEVQWRTDDKLRIRYKDAGNNRAADSSVLSTPAWYHIAAAYGDDLGDNATLYVNGSVDGIATPLVSPSGMDTFAIGDRPAYSTAAPLTGRVADAGLWTALLDTSEVTALQTAAPNRVDTANLVGYWPLRDGNDNDLVGGLHMTATNAPTVEADAYKINRDGGEFGGAPDPRWQTSGVQPAGAEGWRW